MQRYQGMDGGAWTKKIRAATWEIKRSKTKKKQPKEGARVLFAPSGQLGKPNPRSCLVNFYNLIRRGSKNKIYTRVDCYSNCAPPARR